MQDFQELSSKEGDTPVTAKIKNSLIGEKRTAFEAAISKIIRRVATSYSKKCAGCSHGKNCGSQACAACMPKGGFKNMGVMWEDFSPLITEAGYTLIGIQS